MAESGELHVCDPGRGELRHGWFAGLLEGRVGDREALERAVARLNALGVLRADLEIDGGRFSALFDEGVVDGARLGAVSGEELLVGLQALVDCSAEPIAVESTLRCTEVYERETVESLFTTRDGALSCLGRSRGVSPADERRAPPPAPGMALGAGSLKRAVLVSALVGLAFGLLAWRSGWIDRVLSAQADELAVAAGPFAGLLETEVEPKLGDYRVVLRRGEDYPRTLAELEALRAAAATPLDLAALSAVADGQEIHVLLRNEAGRRLEGTAVSLRSLVAREDAEVEVRLPGRIGAWTIELALDSGGP